MLEEWSGEQQGTVYHYDSLKRQQDVSKADGVFQTNRYDAEGLRAEMEENGRLCRFIFHQGEIVNEEQGEDKLVSRYLRGHGVEYLEQEDKRFSFQKDEQSSTVFLLDQEHEIQSCYAYDSFGNVRDQQGSIENRILYTGQQYDGVVEQYYLRARYYNPVIGRFIQEDVYRGDGLNLYAYCGNNPVKYFDPSGYSGSLNCPGVGFEGSGQVINSIPNPGDLDFIGPLVGLNGRSYNIDDIYLTQPLKDPFTTEAGIQNAINNIYLKGYEANPVPIYIYDGKALAIDGHHRLEAYRRLGYDRVPIIYVRKNQISSKYGRELSDVLNMWHPR